MTYLEHAWSLSSHAPALTYSIRESQTLNVVKQWSFEREIMNCPSCSKDSILLFMLYIIAIDLFIMRLNVIHSGSLSYMH